VGLGCSMLRCIGLRCSIFELARMRCMLCCYVQQKCMAEGGRRLWGVESWLQHGVLHILRLARVHGRDAAEDCGGGGGWMGQRRSCRRVWYAGLGCSMLQTEKVHPASASTFQSPKLFLHTGGVRAGLWHVGCLDGRQGAG
jgi:hypothetical protein